MNLSKLHNRIPEKWLIALTVVVLSAILMIGLNPKDLFPPNHAHWLTDRTGIRFEKSSIAYTDSISGLIHKHISPQKGFSIEIALKPKSFQGEGFAFIFLLHGGKDRSQLLIGQWRSSLIVMNGDDYSYSRRIKRISVKSSSVIPTTQFITVTSDTEGTKIYLDGHQMSARKDLQLKIPEGRNTRLLLGNSVHGNHPWRGDIYGIAIFGKALSTGDIETHFEDWSKIRRFSYAKKQSPLIQYNLDEQEGAAAMNFIGESPRLKIPSNMKVLRPNLFFQGWDLFRFDKNILQDALLNFFGFIPFGLLLAATLIRWGGKGEQYNLLITFGAGFLASLLIETAQAWMPARSSDIRDLVLNTAGTFVGAMSCQYFLKHKAPRKTEY